MRFRGFAISANGILTSIFTGVNEIQAFTVPQHLSLDTRDKRGQSPRAFAFLRPAKLSARDSLTRGRERHKKENGCVYQSPSHEERSETWSFARGCGGCDSRDTELVIANPQRVHERNGRLVATNIIKRRRWSTRDCGFRGTLAIYPPTRRRLGQRQGSSVKSPLIGL